MAAKCMVLSTSVRSSIAALRLCGSIVMLKARSRREWRKDRPPALTRLTPDQSEETETRKAYGGHKKVKAIKINHGLYVWNSLDVELECPILKVVHSEANKDFNEMGVIVKGAIVEVDSKPFKTWYSSYYNKEGKPKEANSSLEHLLPYVDSGKLYAKITTRPGQVGVCNGYILEGEELETLFNTYQDLKLSLVENSPGAQ